MTTHVFNKVLFMVDRCVTRLKPLAVLADTLINRIVPETNAFALCYQRRYCPMGCGYDPGCPSNCRKLCYYRWCCETSSGLSCGSPYGHHGICCSGCYY